MDTLFQNHPPPRFNGELPKKTAVAEKTEIRISPHVFRHTAITRALDKGISYRDIQAMTGHRNISTVQRYDSNKFSVEHNAVNRLDYED